ncbi:MAG: DUF262 domain-containing protein [Pedobacter sp.]|nr:MAG: DUF262 domain-containing protein [Pedobacter sp.]
MSYIETNPVQHATILRIYSEKSEIISDPEYQRNGGIWTPEKKQLLIDSIINNYDIPKIYFHQFSRDEKNKTGKSYAIIDGKQRLETIWSFIEGGFCLDDNFEYQDNPDLHLGGLSYDDLAKEYPKIKINFDSFVLPIVGVQTDDVDLIEDMFSRLNEAAPLNAAEKRNAFGGDMVKAIRDVANHSFFTQNVRFNNTRYQHFEIAGRFLLVEASDFENQRLIDTKKVYLDGMVRKYRAGHFQLVTQFEDVVFATIGKMSECFAAKDVLLRAQGAMVVYYLLFKWSILNEFQINRSWLLDFDQRIKDNRKLAEENYEGANFELLEFDRLSQQGTNDASSIRERLRILREFIENYTAVRTQI